MLVLRAIWDRRGVVHSLPEEIIIADGTQLLEGPADHECKSPLIL